MPPTRRQKYASRYKRVFIVFAARRHSGPRGPANGWSRAARLLRGLRRRADGGRQRASQGSSHLLAADFADHQGGRLGPAGNLILHRAKGELGEPPLRRSAEDEQVVVLRL